MTSAADLLVDLPSAVVDAAAVDEAGVERLAVELKGARRCVVVVGASISGLVLASRLGRAEGVTVVLVPGSPPVRRRLIAGCSLRWSTIRRMAAGIGTTAALLHDRLGGPAASFRWLAVERATPGDPAASPRFTRRPGTWAPADPLMGLSTRHGEILSALRSLMAAGPGLRVVAGAVDRAARLVDGTGLPLQIGGSDALLSLPEDRTVICNATTAAELLRPGRTLPEPARWVAAVQAPLRAHSAAPFDGRDVGIAPMTPGRPRPHLAFFTPFADPDTPEANWYVINTTLVRAGELTGIGRDMVAETRNRMRELESHYGFDEIDPDETLGEALVPVESESGAALQARLEDGSPVVDTHRAFTSGAPAINVDGMLAAAVGADVFADAFLLAEGPPIEAARSALAVTDRSLLGIRTRNRLTQFTFFLAPEANRALTARLPRKAWQLFVDDWVRLGG